MTKCLADIEADVAVARQFVDCALLASRQVVGSEAAALSAVLEDTSHRLGGTIEDMGALRTQIYAPTPPEP